MSSGAGCGLETGTTNGEAQLVPPGAELLTYTVLVNPLVELPATCVHVAQMTPVLSSSMVMDSLLLFVMTEGKPESRVYLPPA